MIILACNLKHEGAKTLKRLGDVIVSSSISKLFWTDGDCRLFVFESHLSASEIKAKVESDEALTKALRWLVVIDARSFWDLGTLGLTSERELRAWLLE